MSSPTDLPVGQQRLGDFVIIREIGRGGMGIVYEAIQLSLNRRVALKVLAQMTGLNRNAVSRFLREAEAAAKLHHTNIVPIYATGEEKGTHYYAMELIEGFSLDHVLRQLRPTSADTPAPQESAAGENGEEALGTTGPYVNSPGPSSSSGLSASSLHSGSSYFDTVARLIAEVADALDYAHGQGVIHRDIKPSNLLLSHQGRLSVNDFGLARLLEQPGMTITGELVGTPRYMAPEQIAAGRIPVDHRTDIYSLGVTLYELLTLQPAFDARQRDQLLAQVLQKEPRPPRKVNARVPVDLETICLKAMDKDPARRYQTAGQMAEDLRRYVNRFAILARRAGPLTRLRKWVKRNPALSAALAGILVCVAGVAVLAYQAHQAERQRVEEQAKHEAALLEEKRRSALERAVLAARLEDFPSARQAIRDAEKLGCSVGQIHMLHGQLELYQGHIPEALDHLTRATELLPESVAAWSMRAVADTYAGRNTDYGRSMSEAKRLPAQGPEDLLFLGHAESMLDAERGLATLDEAFRRRPSALAQLVRADALRLRLLDVPDVERAREAMNDIRALKGQLPENAMVLGLSISIHTVCYHFFEDTQDGTWCKLAIEEGTRDALKLEHYASSPRAIFARYMFYCEIGREEVAVPALRQCAEKNIDMMLTYNYGLYLYRQRQFEQAVRMFEKIKGENFVDLYRVLALAELPDGVPPAHRLYQEIAGRDLNEWDHFNSQLFLRILGRQKEAREVSRKLLAQPHRFPPVRREPFRRALEYCAGERSAESLIASMQGNRGDLSNAYLSIAVTALSEGKRAEARKYLQLCRKTRHFEFLPYDVSYLLLSRMDRDPTWPPWIPMPK